MTIEQDQALVRSANERRRNQYLIELERASHPDELEQRWRVHPETEYIIETEDGEYVASTYPRGTWPERLHYGRAYLVAAEAIARSIVEIHNAMLEGVE